MKHVAFNTITGEVLFAKTSNQLNKMVKTVNHSDKRFYPSGFKPHWKFSHNGTVKGAHVFS